MADRQLELAKMVERCVQLEIPCVDLCKALSDTCLDESGELAARLLMAIESGNADEHEDFYLTALELVAAIEKEHAAAEQTSNTAEKAKLQKPPYHWVFSFNAELHQWTWEIVIRHVQLGGLIVLEDLDGKAQLPVLLVTFCKALEGLMLNGVRVSAAAPPRESWRILNDGRKGWDAWSA